ncbi:MULTISPECIES: flavin monoamine oxidase family protein [unclassified Cyanobium]|uniref:flavin monoamine oxidase family protein n=1 Tax=unclassified Cyanobium TaxID=2627006 RepID=UPI0020CE735D|nr:MULTISPECIES: flavin monoamine oxidase family protein [unclassified Cyanobium]MCP9859918.1 flavin monoamine oxidase family protein [Cyanobium sp. Cruz-8H5]MCP9866984.1 flavin monoamine oxidase family protein [Cyanobium sp. Cruz-8D1]
MNDVVVVGAGLSGLVAARELQRSGLSVTVIEAAPAVGGRMVRSPLQLAKARSPAWVDLGGQWVGPSHSRFGALLEAHGLSRFPSPHHGETVLCLGSHRCTFSGFFQGFPEGQPPSVPSRDWDDAMAALKQFQALVASLPEGHPHRHPDAAALDRLSFQDWIEAHTHTPFAAWYFAYFCRAVGFLGPAEPDQVSLLHVAWGQRTAPQGDHPEEDLIHGGAGQVPALLAEGLGDALVLGEPVRAIHQPDSASGPDADADVDVAVEVITDRSSHRCRAVIVAMPPALAGAIRFTPALPADRLALQEGMAMGNCSKVLIVYGRPWWRETGLSGIGIGDRPWVELCADSSDPETGLGVLAAFVVGRRRERWSALGAEQRRAAVLDDLAAYFGPMALEPLEYVEKNWPQEPFIGGAFAAWMPPGLWTRSGDALLRPHGRVFWAGTEVAERWPGFFEGAVDSGERAAAAVAALLG